MMYLKPVGTATGSAPPMKPDGIAGSAAQLRYASNVFGSIYAGGYLLLMLFNESIILMYS